MALVSPGKLYGVGTGAVRQFTIPFMSSPIIHYGAGFMIGSGVATMGTIHVLDLARLFVLLIGEALKPNGGAADWGVEGYYFGVSDEVSVADHVRIIADELAKLGHIKSNKVEVLSIAEVEKIHQFLPYPFGANTRAVSTRAKKLGWKPVESGVLESLVTDTQAEYARGRAVTHWAPLGL